MNENLHHITQHLLDAYLEEVEHRLSNNGEGRIIISVPVAVEIADGKFTKVITPSNQNILDCLNENFEDEVEIEFTTWEEENE